MSARGFSDRGARSASVFDVAVVGAGPAGSVAAAVLAAGGRSVALIDRATAMVAPASRKIGESLPAAARPLLASLGLLGALESGRHLPAYGMRSAWGDSALTSVDSLFDPNGHGWTLDRRAFDADLRGQARARGAVLIESDFDSAARATDGFSMKLSNGEALQAKRLIDCAGRSAPLARACGAERLRDDDAMSAYAWFRLQAGAEASDRRGLIESAESGWWYANWLPEGEIVVAYHSDAREAGAVSRSQAAWDARLNETLHVRRLLRGTERLAEVRCSDAGSAHLSRFYGDGWAVAGDAAMSFDPLSSQGIFNAIYSGMKAAEATMASLMGDGRALERYSDRLSQIYSVYLSRRLQHYASERRWPRSPFWRTRVARASAAV